MNGALFILFVLVFEDHIQELAARTNVRVSLCSLSLDEATFGESTFWSGLIWVHILERHRVLFYFWEDLAGSVEVLATPTTGNHCAARVVAIRGMVLV